MHSSFWILGRSKKCEITAENAPFHNFTEIKSLFSREENRFLSFGCLKEEGESFFSQIPPAFFVLLRN